MPVPRAARLLLLPLAGAASLATTMESGTRFESTAPPEPGRSTGWGRDELRLEPLAAPASFTARVLIELDPPSELVYDRFAIPVTIVPAAADTGG